MRALTLSVLLAIGCTDTAKPGTDTASTAAVDADADGDGYASSEDCDDNNSLVNPGAVELCDGFDNNCDGAIDEGVTTTYYADSDADGFGDEDAATESCEQPPDHVPNGNDCDDATAEAFPGGVEVCDGIDNNCDSQIDEGVGSTFYADTDGDGFGDEGAASLACSQPSGHVADATDCDDTDASAFPGGAEVCDEADNNCDGTIDEGVTTTFYADADADTYGVSDSTTEACSLPTGHADRPGDCDDTDEAVSPDAYEICDEQDNDCDGDIDEDDALDAGTFYADSDGDGFGDASASTVACSQPRDHVADATDCDDTDATTSPDADEYCDGEDDDCDGDIDEDDALDAATFYADADSDGYGDPDASTVACSQPSGHVADATDCDDTEATTSPGDAEYCDGVDNDCDGDIDEDDALDADYWYADADGDGYGDPDEEVSACAAPTGHVEDDTDCDDADATASPGESEVCDGVDNDCDGVEDDGVLGTGTACPAEDCAEILSDDSSAADGDYELDVGTYTCDMTTDGGGWTLVQDAAYVYGTGYDTTYYNSEGFSWDEVLFAYNSGSVTAHCTYPGSMTGCNNLGFQFGAEYWGVALNWGSSLCSLTTTTSYTSATSYIGGYDFVISRTQSTDTIRLGTLEGVASCTTSDNPGSAYVDIYVRR